MLYQRESTTTAMAWKISSWISYISYNIYLKANVINYTHITVAAEIDFKLYYMQTKT